MIHWHRSWYFMAKYCSFIIQTASDFNHLWTSSAICDQPGSQFLYFYSISSNWFVLVNNLSKASQTGNTQGERRSLRMNHPYSWLRPDIISINLSIYSLQIFWLTNLIFSRKVCICSVMPHCVNRPISQVHTLTLHPLHINDPLNLILLKTRLAFSTISQIIISMNDSRASWLRVMISKTILL